MESIAQTLSDVPDDSLESQLVTFDMLVGLGDDRPAAAKLLREAAGRCSDPQRRERVLRAAVAVALGEPCALNEHGLTWKQAAEANTITLEEWQEQEAAEQAARLAPDPPPMPHLGLWDMFPGMAIRIAQTFLDHDGQEVRAGEILRFVSIDYMAYHGGYTIDFAEKQVRLCELVPANGPMIENEGNAYFEPLPDLHSLKLCVALIEDQWKRLDILRAGNIPRIRSEIDMCRHWVLAGGDRGPAPVCFTAPLAAKVFSGNDEKTEGLAFRIAFLFAGVRRCAEIQAAPSGMPHISVWRFFKGLVVRIRRTFRDFDGQEIPAGLVLHFLEKSHFFYDDGHTLTFLERVIRLSGNIDDEASVIENAGNAWFDPLPELESLQLLWESVYDRWKGLDSSAMEHAADIGAAIEQCGDWLRTRGTSAPPHAPQAAAGDAELAFQIAFLFAGVKCLSSTPASPKLPTAETRPTP